ncbi:MAG: curli assembly protein CsgG, partial [Limisphaerales bacterium]
TAPITDLTSELAGKIGKTVTEKRDTLVSKALTHEERVTRLLKGLGEGKRRSISVKIPEQHYGSPVIDPAAETELAMLLQKAGFIVLDEKSAEKPELELTGEAFSAYGLRKGNLISCKARVEIKIRDMSSGRIVASERQTSVAIDIAEQTAAKTALQSAALQLAERLLPQLTK